MGPNSDLCRVKAHSIDTCWKRAEAASVSRFWTARDLDMLITKEASDAEVLAQLRYAGVKIETVR